MRKLLVALVVLAGLLVALDRVLVVAAENVVARRIQVTAGLDEEPTVEIRGFPFLTQAIGGVYRHVAVSLSSVERGDVRLEDLVVHLRDVHAPLGQMLRSEGSVSVRAESATASATVPYAVIEARVPGDVQVTPEGDRLRLASSGSFLGRGLSGAALVEVSAEAGELVFDATEIRVEGRTVTSQLADEFSFTIEVGELPFGLRIAGVRVTRNGLRVVASAENVRLTEPAAAEANVTPPPPALTIGSVFPGTRLAAEFLTRRRAVDFCRVATALCRTS